MLILLICQTFIVNYQHVKKVIPLTLERALSIYAQTQQKFLIVQIRRLVKWRHCFFFTRWGITFYSAGFTTEFVIWDKQVASVLVGISAQTRFLIYVQRSLTDTEKNILEKGLDFAQIKRQISEPELRKALEENFWKFLRISVRESESSGTFEIIFQKTSVRTVRLHLSPNGSHLSVMSS